MLKGAVKSTNRNTTKRDMKKEPPSVSMRPQRDKKVPSAELQLSDYQSYPEKCFPSAVALAVMKDIVDEKLGEMEYSKACSAVATELSDSIKEAVKSLSCGRYKLISYVAIGQRRDSAVTCSSRGLWSPTADTFTEYVFKNQHLFALCVLFAVYQE
ncbi:dynein light chain Tctex-type 5 [Trichomycterus rosablanca]|uniref:dynein light chain Tctex-type 5 n=1 Tax=Trichomycterus rosablanca TaxID=2290929 RepID=UPI002F35B245